MMDPTEFRRILHNGLGRALLYLRDHDAAPHRDAILHACLHNTSLDPQVEGNKATYIYEAIVLTREVEFYRNALLAALREPHDGHDLGQICDVLARFAQGGDEPARQALYDAFGHRGTGAEEAMFALVEAEGLDGFLHIAERIGPDAANDDNFWEGEHFLWQLNERYAEAVVEAALAEASAANPRLAAYIAEIEAGIERKRAQQRPSARVQIDATMGYDEVKAILSTAANGSPATLHRWVEQATDDDLARFATDVLGEAAPSRLHAFLRAFRERPFPLGHAPLIRFTESEHPRVVHAAFQALGAIRHPDIRALALDLLPTRRAWAALSLLLGNYQEGDYALIERALANPNEQGEDEEHWLGMGVRRVIEKYPHPDAVPCLLLLYEYSRCSFCRYSIVKLLHKLGGLSEAIRLECEYDADLDLRAAARSHFQVD